MAVTRNGNVIRMTAAADAVTGFMNITAAWLDHTAAANAVVNDTAVAPVLTLRTTASVLRDHQEFDPPIHVNGIVATTLSAGTLYIVTV